MKRLTGREVLVKSIAACGVRHVFTVVTDRLLPVIEALESEPGMTVVRARDEIAATLMADGYTRRAMRHGLVLTDSGGRSLAQVSGVTNAWADKVPLLSVSLASDEDPDPNKGWDRTRFDQTAVFGAVTRWRQRASSVPGIAKALASGAAVSRTGKMGPVHVDVPAELLARAVPEQDVAFPDPPQDPKERIAPPRIAGDLGAVRAAIAVLKKAERPLVLSGGGVKASGASPDLVRFIEEFKIPAATTMAGMGTIPSDHPLCLGGPSYTAGEAFHAAIKEADVVLAVGAAFSGLEGFGLPPLWSEKIRFIHVDLDPLQVGLNVSPEVSILGDAKTVLSQLSAYLRVQGFAGRPAWGPWRRYLARLKKDRKTRLEKNAAGPWPRMHQGRLAQMVGEVIGSEHPLLVIDGGNTPLYAAMYAPAVGPGQAFFPFGMAALGGGVPYAIGVALASPGERVVLVTGDGSFLYAVQELETMARLKLPVTIFVNNDSAWNMIKAFQDTVYEKNYVGSCLPDIDYARVARGFGLHAQRVVREKDFPAACKAAMAQKGPALVDCVTDCKNLPDSLISFGLVEFEGALKHINPIRVARSLWMNRDQGLARTAYHMAYIRKALLRINPKARKEARKEEQPCG